MDIETVKALRPDDEDFKTTNEKSSSAYDLLVSQLDETAQTLLEKYLDLHDHAAFITRKQTFAAGFSIAIKLLTESIHNSTLQF